MTALLALLSSAVWGVADFLGGTASRRHPVLVVVGLSQTVGFVVLLVVAAVAGSYGADPAYVPWALGAGVSGLVGVLAFYRALAVGTMGVVAPLAGVGLAIPVLAGLATGEAPTALQLGGLAVCGVGVVLSGGPEVRSGVGGVRPVALALVAAAGFGLVVVLIAKGSRHDVVMTLLLARAVTAAVLAVALVAGRRLPRGPADLALIAAIGLADLAANASYAVAVRSGLLSVVAVLSSLYPAVTVVLARWVHRERLRRVQVLGVVTVLTGVALIGAGGGAG